MVASRKRKRKHVGGGDDGEATYGLRQILPVANLPIDFDGEPMDGMQYLFTVRRDARRIPDIKHVDNPYTLCPPRPAQSAVQPLSEPTGNVEAPSPLPSKEWRSKFEHRFRNFRGNISQPTTHTQQAGPSQKMVPDKKNRDAWWAFLEGAPESVWNLPQLMKPGATRQPPYVTAFDGDATQKPRELSPTQLFQLDHRFSLQLVMYFTHWFNLYLGSLDANSNSDDKTIRTYAPTDIHMRWIFALLTRIDIFCSADEMSGLRNLARACLALISVVRRRKVGSSQLSADDEQADRATEMDTSGAETYTTPLDSSGDHKTLSECSIWVVFCAVTSIWGQRDLWDDANEALRQNPL